MSIRQEILQLIERNLSTTVTDSTAVGGGSINHAYCLATNAGKYFIKINSMDKFPGMFKAEAAGLTVIAATAAIRVPQVLLCDNAGNESFLLMEWIDARRSTAKASEELGRNLAQMHRRSADYFGLDYDNYMGSLPQSNKIHNNWADFFIEERLMPMVSIAMDKQLLTKGDIADFGLLYKNLSGLFDEEAPALIHGDLWGGNYLVDTNERPFLIDPAICYGHREFDMAMTSLFGGFSNEFYRAYRESFPLAKGWEGRIDLWNLYPLLVHLNLFGGGYLGQVRDCLRGYV
jgi:protein-ribulosamine 3-kinase